MVDKQDGEIPFQETEQYKRWAADADADFDRRRAEQAFINLLIQQTHDAEAFHACPDRDNLYNIVELALRLALTCHKQEGKGPVNGYGIKNEFVRAVRHHKEQHDLEKRQNRLHSRRKKATAAKEAK